MDDFSLSHDHRLAQRLVTTSHPQHTPGTYDLVPRDMWTDKGMSDLACRVVGYIASYGRRAFPSHDKIVADLAVRRSTLLRAVACAERCGYLIRERRFTETGRQTSNWYLVNFPPEKREGVTSGTLPQSVTSGTGRVSPAGPSEGVKRDTPNESNRTRATVNESHGPGGPMTIAEAADCGPEPPRGPPSDRDAPSLDTRSDNSTDAAREDTRGRGSFPPCVPSPNVVPFEAVKSPSMSMSMSAVSPAIDSDTGSNIVSPLADARPDARQDDEGESEVKFMDDEVQQRRDYEQLCEIVRQLDAEFPPGCAELKELMTVEPSARTRRQLRRWLKGEKSSWQATVRKQRELGGIANAKPATKRKLASRSPRPSRPSRRRGGSKAKAARSKSRRSTPRSRRKARSSSRTPRGS